MHNDPGTWDKPEEFSVERHLDGKGNFIKSSHIIPFGLGKHVTASLVKVIFSNNLLPFSSGILHH